MIYPSCMLRWLYRIKFKFSLYGNHNMKYYIDYMYQNFEIKISTNLLPK